MADGPIEGKILGNLYALFVYLNVSSNHDLLDAIIGSQLSTSQLLLLDRLRGGRRRPTIQQAATLIHVGPTGASRLVEDLAQRGLVTRDTDEKDFRYKRIVITEAGEQTIARMHAARLQQIAEFAQGLSPVELDRLEPALDVLLEREPIAACRPMPLPV